MTIGKELQVTNRLRSFGLRTTENEEHYRSLRLNSDSLKSDEIRVLQLSERFGPFFGIEPVLTALRASVFIGRDQNLEIDELANEVDI